MIDFRRDRLVCVMAFWLAFCVAGNAEPLDACALPAADLASAAAPMTGTVDRITGPNAFKLRDGREIRLASVTTPHRFALPSSPAAEREATLRDAAGEVGDEPETAPEVNTTDATEPIAAARSALAAWLVGQDVRIYPVSPMPDRYGRIRARILRASDGLWVEAELAKAGLARVEPQRDDFGCARQLEGMEAGARAEQRGLWTLPEFAVVEATDITRDRWIGHYMLIEGQVVSLGGSAGRRYLNFGRNFSRDFAVLLVDKGTTVVRGKAKRTQNRFQLEGFDAPTVAGKRIRVRGVLMVGGGGLILPTVPEEIEWVQDQHER